MDADLRRFIETGAGTEGAGHRRRRDATSFEIGRNADAPQLALRLGVGPPLLETGKVGPFQRHLQRRLVVAAVILQRYRSLVGEGVGRDHVLAADLDAIHLHLARRLVDETLEQIGRLRPPGAAIGVDRHGVGVDRVHLGIDRRGGVDAGQQRRVEIGRNARGEGRQIRAHGGNRAHLQTQELAVLVHGHLGMGDVVAAMRVGHEGLAAVRRPLDRTAELAGRPGDDGLPGVVEDLRPKPPPTSGATTRSLCSESAARRRPSRDG
jgi:hypothetical protein